MENQNGHWPAWNSDPGIWGISEIVGVGSDGDGTNHHSNTFRLGLVGGSISKGRVQKPESRNSSVMGGGPFLSVFFLMLSAVGRGYPPPLSVTF